MRRLVVFLLLLLAPMAEAQINVYSVFFDKQGHLSEINSPSLKKTRKDLAVKVSINLNDSLITSFYKPYFEKHLDLINNIDQSDNSNELETYFGFTPAEIKSIKDSSYCYVDNFPLRLKALFGYEKIAIPCGLSCTNLTPFNPYEIKLTGYPFNPKNNLAYKSSTIPEYFGDWLTYSTTLDEFGSDIKHIKYDLYFNKPEAQHFNASIGSFPSKTEFNNTVKSLGEVNKIMAEVNKFPNSEIDDINVYEDQIFPLLLKLRSIDAQVSAYFLSHKDMVKQWLWFTKGKPTLNPFYENLTEGQLKELTDKIRQAVSDSVAIGADLSGAQLVYSDLKETVKNNIGDQLSINDLQTAILPAYEKMNKSINTLKTDAFSQKVKLESLRFDQKKLKEDLAKAKKTEQEFHTKNIFWYEGHVFPGKIGLFSPKKWQVFYRNYDRLNNLRLFQSAPSSYDESSKVYLLIENESVKNKFSSAFKSVNEESPVSAQVIPALDAITVLSLSEVLKDKSISVDATSPPAVLYLNEIRLISNRLQYFQKNLLPPPNIPKAFAADEKARLFTDFHSPLFPDTAKKSYMVYTKVVRDKQIDTIGLRVNKLYYILPTAGLMYSMAKNPEVTLNPDGSFKEAKHFNGFGLMVGLKLFPFGAPINDPQFIVSAKRSPVFDYRKLHFTLGVNALHPLQQFYVGAGLDLWSGLSVTGGFHLLYKSQNKLVNNVVDSKHYLDYNNGYLGINLDVPVVVKLITILFR